MASYFIRNDLAEIRPLVSLQVSDAFWVQVTMTGVFQMESGSDEGDRKPSNSFQLARPYYL